MQEKNQNKCFKGWNETEERNRKVSNKMN